MFKVDQVGMGEGKVRAAFVATGLVASSGNKTSVVLERLDEGGQMYPAPSGQFIATYSKLKSAVAPGTVVSLECTADYKSIWPGTAKWLGMWPDVQQRTVWQALWRTFQAAQAAERLQAKETQRNLINERMEPLRLAYWKTNSQGKEALAALVMGALMHPLHDYEKMGVK